MLETTHERGNRLCVLRSIFIDYVFCALTTYFYLELTLPQENVPSPLLALKCGLQYQMMLSLQPRLPLNGN